MLMWLVAAAALVLGLLPLGFVCARRRPVDGLAGSAAGTVVVTLALLLLSVGFDRSPYADLALVLAALSFAGAMVFIRFVERWE
jgi:multisubunit Na+/H+ antiporter MnhF subunit